MLDLWFKDAVVYCLDVETYADSNGDGVGDFVGLSRRLDYLAGIGVTCLWLLPFYASPNRDNGYDISDYYGIDPRFGNLGDFVEFTHQASLRGIRVIVDLVVNHTSDQHPWFQLACQDPKGKFYDYYVWSEKKPKDDGGVVFPGVQKSTWTYNKDARAYYFHRFYDFQPDLNVGNPVVREEILKIMGFWIQLGVSGFRLDAAPFLVEMTGIKHSDLKDPMDFLTQMREFLSWRSRDAIILAEANLPPKEAKAYFGDNDDDPTTTHGCRFEGARDPPLWRGFDARSAGDVMMPNRDGKLNAEGYQRQPDQIRAGSRSLHRALTPPLI